MKQYMMFAGYNYYPEGGWDDFQGARDTVEDAITDVAALGMDWWHVVKVDSGIYEKVWDSRRGRLTS